MHNKNYRIGLLATGNELTEGDILNIDGQLIAQNLVESGLDVGLHVVASDLESDIESGLRFLLDQHSIVIITGGLGPTSDDRTRYVLAKVIGKELILDEVSWQQLIARFERLKLKMHPSNRQQALFPQDAQIIPNEVGSAAGCCVQYQDKIIYMLPGPPSECLPMFRKAVLPAILAINPVHERVKLKWRLLGAIEADIAAQLDEITKKYPVTTGYRIDFPYLEVKVYTTSHLQFDEMLGDIKSVLQPYLISDSFQVASELLKDAIMRYPGLIVICDEATNGRLQALIATPENYQQLRFVSQITDKKSAILYIKIKGLEGYWNGQLPTGHTLLTFEFSWNEKMIIQELQIPFRNAIVVKYAVEYAAKAIFDFLLTTGERQ